MGFGPAGFQSYLLLLPDRLPGGTWDVFCGFLCLGLLMDPVSSQPVLPNSKLLRFGWLWKQSSAFTLSLHRASNRKKGRKGASRHLGLKNCLNFCHALDLCMLFPGLGLLWGCSSHWRGAFEPPKLWDKGCSVAFTLRTALGHVSDSPASPCGGGMRTSSVPTGTGSSVWQCRELWLTGLIIFTLLGTLWIMLIAASGEITSSLIGPDCFLADVRCFWLYYAGQNLL